MKKNTVDRTDATVRWKVYHENGSMGSGGHWGIESPEGTMAIMSQRANARNDAAQIVRDHNCHNELVAIAGRAIAIISTNLSGEFASFCDDARAAIANATKSEGE